jgi:hypothetical protein
MRSSLNRVAKARANPNGEELSRKTGRTFDDRLGDRAWAPGTLSIYNVRTDKLYAITTGQGDSQILLVEGDTVYYRANTKLFSARIGPAVV